MSNFWEDVMPGGYYDEVLLSGIKAGRGIQPNWHNITFLEVGKYVEEDLIHLDYACGPGTFIGNYLFNNSLGVDISNEQIKYANKNYGNKARFLNLEEYENSEIMVDHSFMSYPDGTREAVMLVAMLKDGKILHMETGATSLD